MELSKSPTYYLMLESYLNAIKKGRLISKTVESADILSYDRSNTNNVISILQDVAVIDQNILSVLKIDEIKLITQIIAELKMNNALWYYKPLNARNYKTLQSLIAKEIIKKTEESYIFVVNPQFVRRGTITSVLAETMQILSTSSRVNKNMIRDLNYRTIKINQIDADKTSPI